MLVIDELKKNDPQLRLVALLIAAGLFILVAGLWWVQVVSAREYQEHLVTQAYRTIRVPAVRGKILDCEGRVLAENQPRYNLSLYLGELAGQFKAADNEILKQAHTRQKDAIAAREKQLGRSLTKAERKQFAFTGDQLEILHAQARDQVAAAEIAQISRNIGQPIPFDVTKFNRHYSTALAMPFPILENLTPEQIARFQENYTNGFGADLELQSMRYYPNGTTAAHVLGELRQDDSSIDGEDPVFNYRMPDYKGVTGIEGSFNSVLHGLSGQVSVMVNNMGYRQAEDVEAQPQAGRNVVLTLDLDLQEAAEKSVAEHQPKANVAVVVMNVRNGDVLAMVSTPTFDPNDFAQAHGIAAAKYEELQQLTAEKNRATQENYAPGSTFKVIVGLAALDAGLNPAREYRVDANPESPDKGMFFGEGYKKKDTAPPGMYDFKHALEKSSNSYFIQVGLNVAGVDRIVALAQRFHFGQKCYLPTRQETKGNMPTLERVHHDWRPADTANICIGQGEVAVTPLQMAAAYSAIANGGTLYWPRLVSRVEPQDPASGEATTNYTAGIVRDHIGVSRRSLKILFDAMLGETEEGTGKNTLVDGLDICGKTGTAQVQDSSGNLTGYNFWFGSFAPYENPKYAVIVLVQAPPEHGSGGVICAPIAHDIWAKILEKEQNAASKTVAAVNPR